MRDKKTSMLSRGIRGINLSRYAPRREGNVSFFRFAGSRGGVGMCGRKSHFFFSAKTLCGRATHPNDPIGSHICCESLNITQIVPLTSTVSLFINLFVSDEFCFPRQTLSFSVSDFTWDDETKRRKMAEKSRIMSLGECEHLLKQQQRQQSQLEVKVILQTLLEVRVSGMRGSLWWHASTGRWSRRGGSSDGSLVSLRSRSQSGISR